MKVVITGGAGFLGQLLIRALCERGTLSRSNRRNDGRNDTRNDGSSARITRIIAIDQAQSGKLFVDDRVEYAIGDISGKGFLADALSRDTDSVFHLAAVVSGGAEADFDLGMRVNVDATRALLDACREQHGRPRVVFSSSVAVFGSPLPEILGDATTPTPKSSYGIQKLIGELLVADYSRQGVIAGRSVRLPTVVVRPGKPNACARKPLPEMSPIAYSTRSSTKSLPLCAWSTARMRVMRALAPSLRPLLRPSLRPSLRRSLRANVPRSHSARISN